MDDFFGLGALFSPTQPTAPAAGDPEMERRTNGWKQALSDPKLQAGLLNFGVQLMTPRWSAGSALPDALSAGFKTIATEEADQYAKAQREQDRKDKQDQAAADRANRLQIAKIGSDSRAEVANIRTQAMLEAANIRSRLLGGRSKPEETFWQNIYARTKSDIDTANRDALLLGRKIVPPEEIDRRAKEAADMALTHRRALGMPQFGPDGSPMPETPQGSPVPGEKTRQNPAPAAPPVGTPGAPQAPKITSGNTPPNVQTKPPGSPLSSEEFITKLDTELGPDAIAGIFNDEARYQRVRKVVADPQRLDMMRRAYQTFRKQ